MPQIRCPNCGLTINLARRKKIDFGLIKDATKRKAKTFTELLHITRLPRKTLNLRLKELCKNGTLVKKEKKYRMNGSASFEDESSYSIDRFSRVFRNDKMKNVLMLIMLAISFSASGYVLAKLLPPLRIIEDLSQEPVILGNVTMDLSVQNIEDLYAWQVAIVYNQSQLKVLEITPGEFIGDECLFVNSTDSLEDLLLLGGTLKGETQGMKGSGILATIAFGYYTEDHNDPPASIVPKRVFETFLVDSQNRPIPIGESTLTLTTVERP